MTLNLSLKSNFLESFNFTFTGLNLEDQANKIAEEFYESNELKPIKILIDGSPFAYQSELAEMLAKFYSLHRVQSRCFLHNSSLRLVSLYFNDFDAFYNFYSLQKRKVKKVAEYIEHMTALITTDQSVFDGMIEKAKNQLSEYQEKLEVIANHLSSETTPELQQFIVDRLTSFGCAKHQGYVMDGFELNSETASNLFLDENTEFNEMTKPDFIIIMNRNLEQDELCVEDNGETDDKEREMKKQLRDY